MYRGAGSSQNSDLLQRDAVIAAMKKELYDLRDKEHEYISVSDKVHNTQSIFTMLKEEKERKQYEFAQRTDINRKNIAELRGEADNLKIQIHKTSVHIEDVLRETNGVKRAVDNRQNQIAQLMSVNQELEAKNQHTYEENKAVSGKIKSTKEDRNKIDGQNEKLQLQLEDSINQLKKLQKEARFLQSSNNKLANMLIVAEKDHSDLMYEMKSRDDMVSSTNKKLDQFNKEIEGLKDKINKVEKDCTRKEQELKNASDQLDQLVAKNKEHAKKIKQGENALRGIQNELDNAILQKDALENDNAQYNAQHKLLSSQIDNVLLQIIEFERVNNDMKKQIQNFISSDEEARNMLDRKSGMRKMLETVASRLGQTSSHIAHLR